MHSSTSTTLCLSPLPLGFLSIPSTTLTGSCDKGMVFNTHWHTHARYINYKCQHCMYLYVYLISIRSTLNPCTTSWMLQRTSWHVLQKLMEINYVEKLRALLSCLMMRKMWLNVNVKGIGNTHLVLQWQWYYCCNTNQWQKQENCLLLWYMKAIIQLCSQIYNYVQWTWKKEKNEYY